jgi:steroid delta-isomerase-like uncharacterized protein
MPKRTAFVLLILSFAVPGRLPSREQGLIEQALAAWSSHDPERVVSFYTDDVVYEDVPLGLTKSGKEELRQFAISTFRLSPDITFEVNSTRVSNGHGVAEVTMHGTDKEFLKTGKTFSVRGVSVFEIRGGKISRDRDYYDVATIMRQVGLLPEKKSKAQ